MRSVIRSTLAALGTAALSAGALVVPVPAGGPAPALAQNLFETLIRVNDQAITRFEIEQRARMLALFRAPGDPNELAREQLIEERLKMDAANANGFLIEDVQIQAGMEEFAGRANMDAEQLIRALEGAGVARETFREFVRVGITWREFMRARFASRVAVSTDDLDRARAAVSGEAGVRVLVSELIMPTGNTDPQVVQERAERISQITTEAEFSAQVRRYSAAASRGRGGRLPWQNLSDLPAGLRPVLLGLAPGEVSDPLPVDGAVALFQLRDIEETDAPPPEYSAIEYAAYYIDGGRSEQALNRARQVDEQTDTCDDLYGIAQGQPESVLERGSKAPGEIPQDIAFELARLDPGETSANVTRSNGQTLVLLMMCGRTTKLEDEGPSDDELTNFIRNQRLDSFANGYLEQLRAEARIIAK